jgi:hypothetical protein
VRARRQGCRGRRRGCRFIQAIIEGVRRHCTDL